MTLKDLEERVSTNLPTGLAKFGILATTILLAAISGAVGQLASECIQHLTEKKCQRPGLIDQAELWALSWKQAGIAIDANGGHAALRAEGSSRMAITKELHGALLTTGGGICEADLSKLRVACGHTAS